MHKCSIRAVTACEARWTFSEPAPSHAEPRYATGFSPRVRIHSRSPISERCWPIRSWNCMIENLLRRTFDQAEVRRYTSRLTGVSDYRVLVNSCWADRTLVGYAR